MAGGTPRAYVFALWLLCAAAGRLSPPGTVARPQLLLPHSLSAVHGNYPASLAGWVTTDLVCEQRFATRCVFTAHCTKDFLARGCPARTTAHGHAITSPM